MPTPTNHVIVRLASPATGGAVDAVAVDASGVVYMLARSQHQVFRRTVLGVITPYAGTGANGFSGDGGPATAAALDDPTGLAVNGAGELYIADSGNRRIRKVSAAGIISTVAGTGANGSAGDGGSPALATFKDLAGIAVRPDGHLLLADRGARVVREIDFAGNTIRGVFGTGNPNGGGDGQAANLTGLTRPVDVSAYDGVFAVADDATGLLWEVTADGIAHLLAGGGTETTAGSMATQFRFDSLRAVAIMESGASGLPHDLLVVDRGTSRVWKLNRQTRRMEAYAGTGVSGNADLLGLAAFAQLDHPEDIVSRAAGDYIADTGNDAVRFVFR